MSRKNVRQPQDILRDTVKQFKASHELKEISSARMEYSIYNYKEIDEAFTDATKEIFLPTDEDKLMERQILELQNPDDMIRFMRKAMNGANRILLRKILIDHEDELTDGIKKKSITIRQDYFIENALYFFLHSRENNSEWIYDNLTEFYDPYMRSMMCLVIGFRGKLKYIQRMMDETDYFLRTYPDEEFDQGPLLAVYELSARFL